MINRTPTHRATVYEVRVRRRGDPGDDSYQRLGDFTGTGKSLVSAVEEIAKDLAVATQEGTTRITCTGCETEDDEVFLWFRHGQSGQAADILDADDVVRFHQGPEHTHSVNRACLFVLPRDQTRGWLAAHVVAGRSVKGLLDHGLEEGFREHFRDFVIEISPWMTKLALQTAAEQDRIDSVELIKLVQPTDIADAAVDMWTKSGRPAKVVVDILGLNEVEGRRGPRQLRDRISPEPVRRYFAARDQEQRERQLEEILVFRGLRFDEAQFEVRMPNATTRTFRLSRPSGGHPVSEDLAGLRFENGEPLPASLRQALKRALQDVLRER